MTYSIVGLALVLTIPALAAGTLTGTVTNTTTGQPAVGDEVLLLNTVSGRVVVAGRGVTGSGGRYQFSVDGFVEGRRVRVVHQGVGYDKASPAGAKDLDFHVYDTAEKLEGVTAISYVQLLQAQGGKLGAVDEITVRNASSPPRALAGSGRFEVQLPAGAEVLAGRMLRPGGYPAAFKPMSGGQDRYYFPAPLLPGETRFAVAYQLPYRGEAELQPKISFPVERLTVQFPRSMKFEGKVPGMFQPRPDQGELQVTEAVYPAQAPAFRISGTGALAPVQNAKPGGPTAKPAAPAQVQRTAPVKPGSQSQSRWFLPGAAALVLAGGAAGLFAHKRRQTRARHSSVVIAPASSCQ